MDRAICAVAGSDQLCALCGGLGAGAAASLLAGVGGMCCISRATGEEYVKLVLFQTSPTGEINPAVLAGDAVVDISSVVKKRYTPQLTMQGIIDDFDRLRPSLEKLAKDGPAVALDKVRLRAPLPRPGKFLCCIANYWEHAQRERRPLSMFLKNPDAVIGPGDAVVSPNPAYPIHQYGVIMAEGHACMLPMPTPEELRAPPFQVIMSRTWLARGCPSRSMRR